MVGQTTLSVEGSMVLPVPKRVPRNGTKAGGLAAIGNVTRVVIRLINHRNKVANSGLQFLHRVWARVLHCDRPWVPDPAKPCRSCPLKPEKRHRSRLCPILTLKVNFRKEKSLSLLTVSKRPCRFFTDVRECAAATWDRSMHGG